MEIKAALSKIGAGKDLTGEIWERAIRLDQPFEVAK